MVIIGALLSASKEAEPLLLRALPEPAPEPGYVWLGSKADARSRSGIPAHRNQRLAARPALGFRPTAQYGAGSLPPLNLEVSAYAWSAESRRPDGPYGDRQDRR
jgi:hypothetical protein